MSDIARVIPEKEEVSGENLNSRLERSREISEVSSGSIECRMHRTCIDERSCYEV